MTAAAFRKKFKNAKGIDTDFTACCPAHNDKSPSLSVRLIDNKWLLKCFAGCENKDIVAALGLKMSDLFLKGSRTSKKDRQLVEKFNAEYEEVWDWLTVWLRENRIDDYRTNDFEYAEYLFDEFMQAFTTKEKLSVLKVAKDWRAKIERLRSDRNAS
jgi:hypothetical protein